MIGAFKRWRAQRRFLRDWDEAIQFEKEREELLYFLENFYRSAKVPFTSEELRRGVAWHFGSKR